MVNLDNLLTILGYDQSRYYYSTDEEWPDPRTSHLIRSAQRAGVKGVYVFQSSPDQTLPLRPAVYVAEAPTLEQARIIHRSLWNLGQVPFLIILLPNQIRVYTGFDYSTESIQVGLVEQPINTNLDSQSIKDQLADLLADSIDIGRIWEAKSQFLSTNTRVDTRLLENLSKLGDILINEYNLPSQLAHALIGKYVYIRYLRDRRIVSDTWLEENNLNLEMVLGSEATIEGLQKLTYALEYRFNGDVFPLDFSEYPSLTNTHISLIASVFAGDELIKSNLRQLTFDFNAYDFRFIPIELLSSIYEQFLRVTSPVRKLGAYYTPEYVADYLVSEIDSIKPLKRGMKILDPSCGSGVFLVLAYRRLVEQERITSADEKINPTVLRDILLESLYGVERERDACYVAEFSLILTLLDYIDPPELHKNKKFRFPSLHNIRIFECDFFDDSSKFWQLGLKFDWIVGNPPWVELSSDNRQESIALDWIAANRHTSPIGGNRVAEAFSWRVSDVQKDHGIIGLILHAKSFFNYGSTKYRRAFFKAHKVSKVTNLANMSAFLFNGRAYEPAAIVIYSNTDLQNRDDIIHYGPFFVNQTAGLEKELWTITINEGEIKVISLEEAENGDACTWKYALWGTKRDIDAIHRLRKIFRLSLDDLCQKRGWTRPLEGAQLRSSFTEKREEIRRVEILQGKKYFDNNLMNKTNFSFYFPEDVLKPIPDHMYNIRKRGGDAGLATTKGPHLFLHASWRYVVYSDQDFVIPPRQIGISAHQQDASYLKALSVYLSSSFVKYYLFFNTPEWGIERNRITLKDVRTIPVPELSKEQVNVLSDLYERLVEFERYSQYINREDQVRRVDQVIAQMFDVPEDIFVLANDFQVTRLKLNRGEVMREVIRTPNENELKLYASQLLGELNNFVASSNSRHKIDMVYSRDTVVCSVELLDADPTIAADEVSVKRAGTESEIFLSKLENALTSQISQRFYVRLGFRVFDGPKVSLYKKPRLVDWTRTQALNDADDIIAEVLAEAEKQDW